MARLILSFDSEDYETPSADDAELWWARLLSRYGLTGSFCVVAELARALRDRGRRDVLQAWSEHEISFHSDRHSAHPTHAEFLEEVGWDEGVSRLLREEGRGIADVRELTGQQPAAFCKPGNSWGPQVAAAMPQLGIPVFCDAPLEWTTGRPMWYAGSICLKYHHHFDGYFRMPNADERLPQMKADLLRKLEAAGDGYVVMYTHPCRLWTSAFPDNFTAGRNPDRIDWLPSPLRPESERVRLQDDFEGFLRWLAEDLRPEITTYRELASRCAAGPIRWFSREQLRTLAAVVRSVPEPLPWEGGWLSPAEQWSLLVAAVAHRCHEREGSLAVAERRPLGPVEPPALLDAAFGTSRELLVSAARRAIAEADATHRMPASVRLGAADLGPNALVQACAELLRASASGRLPDQVTVTPVDEVPALARRDDFQRLRFRNTWSIFPPEFEGRRLLEWARLQAWTAKPA